MGNAVDIDDKAPRGRRRARRSSSAGPRAAGDPRERLLRAIVDVVAGEGYGDAKIGAIAKRARVSTATFYDLFADKEECFLAAQEQLGARVETEARRAVAQGEGASALFAILAVLIRLAEQEPHAFLFVTHEALLAGARATERRERTLQRLARLAERSQEQLDREAEVPDIPCVTAIGGAVRVLGFRIRRGESSLERLLPEFDRWLGSYAAPVGELRWNAMATDRRLMAAHTPGPAPVPPQPLPRGRHRLADEVVTRVQRERIARATVEVVNAEGYTKMTVADIVGAAGVSRDTFYTHFADKREAFMASYRDGFERTLVRAAEAFFTTIGAWPDRVWEAGRSFTDVFATQPALAYLGFVQAYALGPTEARRLDDSSLGFTVFLEDGYRFRPEAADVPRVASEALAGAVIETAVSYVRRGRIADLPGLMGVIGYVILAPFTGRAAAEAFVQRKISEASSS